MPPRSWGNRKVAVDALQVALTAHAMVPLGVVDGRFPNALGAVRVEADRLRIGRSVHHLAHRCFALIG